MKAGLFPRLAFRLRATRDKFTGTIRTSLLRLERASIGNRTNIPRLRITWPHQIKIGDNCILEPDIFFKFDGIWCPGPSIIIGNSVFIGRGCEFNIRKKIEIGDGCMIASGCKFVDHDHDVSLNNGVDIEFPIAIKRGVWLGANVIILKGVTIGDGAIVGAGAVVKKSIPSNEIWAGVPAKRIGLRTV